MFQQIRPIGLAALFALLISPGNLLAQEQPATTDDDAAIKAVVLDYIEGFYDGKPVRVERSLHPLLARRTIERIAERDVLRTTSAEQLAALALNANDDGKWDDDASREVTILDHTADVASVKLVAADWIEYLHLARLNGKWVIVDSLWREQVVDPFSPEDMKSPAGDKLPTAQAVLDAYVEATGGKEAWSKIHNRQIVGFIEIPSSQGEYSFERHEQAPGSFYQAVIVMGWGRVERGSDGNVVWERRPDRGLQKIEGDRREQMLRLGRFSPEVNWRDIYSKAQCVGLAKVDGQPCYKLLMTTSAGKTEQWFFNRHSHLLICRIIATPMAEGGEQPTIVKLSDYRKAGDVLYPRMAVQRTGVGPQSRMEIVYFDNVKHNVEMAPDRFALPTELKE